NPQDNYPRLGTPGWGIHGFRPTGGPGCAGGKDRGVVTRSRHPVDRRSLLVSKPDALGRCPLMSMSWYRPCVRQGTSGTHVTVHEVTRLGEPSRRKEDLT